MGLSSICELKIINAICIGRVSERVSVNGSNNNMSKQFKSITKPMTITICTNYCIEKPNIEYTNSVEIEFNNV